MKFNLIDNLIDHKIKVLLTQMTAYFSKEILLKSKKLKKEFLNNFNGTK